MNKMMSHILFMDDQLVKDIQDLFIKHGWTLSLAESCTGGYLAARLVRFSGCSKYFLGSIVAYSNELKMNILKVNPSILSEYGAVSGPVVGQMAQGVLELTGSDYSIAVSGIAGPEGGTLDKPVGTIWGAIAQKGSSLHIWNVFLSGNREEIIEKSADLLLSKLWLLIKSKKGDMK